jgi:periplasmic divalent cation tolerance protein
VIVVLTTVSRKEDGERIAKKLVGERLAACVSILKIEKSCYEWKGEIEEVGEYLLLIKTRKELWEPLERAVRKNHPYEVPELIALDAKKVSAPYLRWVKGAVRSI